MKQTRLYDEHQSLGGRMVPFAGWSLPVQYTAGPTAEHQAVREAAGLFDIDHMGQFRLSGIDAEPFLQYVQVFDVATMEPGDAHYSLLTYEDGSLIDDIFLYRLEESWLIVINAANRDKDLAWLQAHAHGYQVKIEDISAETYMLALQGPRAEEILDPLCGGDLSQLEARRSLRSEIAGIETLIGRTGYTGEDGFELYFADEKAPHIWNAILESGNEKGLLPCGLAARDSLRFEACMPLYGHEMDPTTNPFEARQGWVVSLDKPDFIGRNALLKIKLEGSQRLLVGFEMIDRGVAREGYAIRVAGEEVGHVTSGMKSPTLDRFLGLGYVPRGMNSLGTELEIMVRGTPKRAKVIRRPFYRPRYKGE